MFPMAFPNIEPTARPTSLAFCDAPAGVDKVWVDFCAPGLTPFLADVGRALATALALPETIGAAGPTFRRPPFLVLDGFSLARVVFAAVVFFTVAPFSISVWPKRRQSIKRSKLERDAQA